MQLIIEIITSGLTASRVGYSWKIKYMTVNKNEISIQCIFQNSSAVKYLSTQVLPRSSTEYVPLGMAMT